jgi:DNA invertase Pin-like site-specific DNA recombinase
MGEKAGLWLRVSTGGQDEALQEPDLLKWCADHGYEVVHPYYRVHGKSAYHGQHVKYLDRAIEDMRHGVISVLVVWQSSRIERRGAFNAFELARRVRKAGGRIEYVKDSYLNQVNEMSDVMLALAATKDALESRTRSERVINFQTDHRSNEAVIGKPPWGYTTEGGKHNKRFVPTELGREYLPQIFERVIAGESLRQVANWLEAEGVSPRSDGKPGRWWAKTLNSMIRNETYCGRVREGIWHEVEKIDDKTNVDGFRYAEKPERFKRDELGEQVGLKFAGWGNVISRCEAAVDPGRFALAARALENDPRRARGPVDPVNKAMCAGAIYCPRCDDSPMYRVMSLTTRGGKPHKVPSYRCTGRGPDRKGCGNLVQLAAVDSAVDHLMSEVTSHIYERRVTAGQDWKSETADVKMELRALDPDADDYLDQAAGLHAKLASYKTRDKIEPVVELVPTKETYAGHWAALPDHERGKWLKSLGLKVTAIKVKDTSGTMVRVEGFEGADGEPMRSLYVSPLQVAA